MQRDTSMTEYIWCAVPVFNNGKTIRDVVAGCLLILEHVVVIDDGSTDTDVASLLSGMDVVVLRHEEKLGQGTRYPYGLSIHRSTWRGIHDHHRCRRSALS
ncbi:MAG: glycosyltransferase [Dissulfurimicrobium sp.]|uniref:glycosyltransferase n=1 Tax=Dissulfurimicrobium sp. TaxID=2022436 RepID=UPI004049BBB4